MKDFLHRIHARVGDLWWYTALLFVAQRCGDVINMFVGMWLVPRYVPQEELGAVLPLTQFVSLVGLPLGVIAIPFMKYLNLYAEKGEYGKVKALLRDAFIWTGGLAVVTFLKDTIKACARKFLKDFMWQPFIANPSNVWRSGEMVSDKLA